MGPGGDNTIARQELCHRLNTTARPMLAIWISSYREHNAQSAYCIVRSYAKCFVSFLDGIFLVVDRRIYAKVVSGGVSTCLHYYIPFANVVVVKESSCDFFHCVHKVLQGKR